MIDYQTKMVEPDKYIRTKEKDSKTCFLVI